MVGKQAEELQHEVTALRETLVQAQQSVNAALDKLAALEERAKAVAAAPPPGRKETLAEVKTLEEKQIETLHVARERGQGSGLKKAIDEAEQLGKEQKELVENALEQGPASLRRTLEHFQELQEKQRKLIEDETGKFEAQGIRDVLDALERLNQEQEALLQQILGRRSLTEVDSKPQPTP